MSCLRNLHDSIVKFLFLHFAIALTCHSQCVSLKLYVYLQMRSSLWFCKSKSTNQHTDITRTHSEVCTQKTVLQNIHFWEKQDFFYLMHWQAKDMQHHLNHRKRCVFDDSNDVTRGQHTSKCAFHKNGHLQRQCRVSTMSTVGVKNRKSHK